MISLIIGFTYFLAPPLDELKIFGEEGMYYFNYVQYYTARLELGASG
jgi:hypothetical protein